MGEYLLYSYHNYVCLHVNIELPTAKRKSIHSYIWMYLHMYHTQAILWLKANMKHENITLLLLGVS